MSWRVNLIPDIEDNFSDWTLRDYKSPWAIAKLSAWRLPHKVTFNNPSLLVKYLVALDRQHAMPPEEIWMVYYADSKGHYIDHINHPTWPQIKTWLKNLASSDQTT